MVMVFNMTELLRYEKAHSLCLLVSTAARFYTRSIAWPLVCIYLNDKHVHCYSSLSFKAQMKWPTILKVVALPNFEVTIKWDTFLGLHFFSSLTTSYQTC